MKAKHVSIFINEADTWHGRPLYAEILQMLHQKGIAGGTVVRAIAGFTQSRGPNSTSLLDTEGGFLPVVVEFIETQAQVEKMLPEIVSMVGNRLISCCDTDVIHGGIFSSRQL